MEDKDEGKVEGTEQCTDIKPLQSCPREKKVKRDGDGGMEKKMSEVGERERSQLFCLQGEKSSPGPGPTSLSLPAMEK